MTRRRGFTLIEVMLVLVIIGILAAIAILRSNGIKQRAYVTTIQSDLRNLVTVEEAYFSDGRGYTANFTNLNYVPSSGVTVVIGTADTTGWNATAKHNATTRTCGVFFGNAAPPAGTSQAGVATCP